MASKVANIPDKLALFPREALLGLITPLSRMKNLSAYLNGPEIWCKRDDLISFGMGGNKIRGLEMIMADVLDKQADVLVTGAGAQSNHVRATAAAAAYFGLKCVAVFWGKAPQSCDGNLRMSRMLDAEVFFTGDDERISVDHGIAQHCKLLNKQGLRPYPIPRGGACPLGVLGHMLAVDEVYHQCQEIGLSPGKIVLATGSGGTHAGWLLGARALGLDWCIESYTVSRDAKAVQTEVIRLATEATALLDLNWQFTEKDVLIHDGFIGQGYGIPSHEGTQAIRLLAHTEGLLLDPTYTGKAMAGLLANIYGTDANDGPVIFIHTGGQPTFFAGDGKWLE